MNVLRDLFGAGTWGTGGNMIAWVLCGGIAFAWSHVKAVARHDELMKQVAANHADMKQHVTDAAATSPTADSEGM